MFTHVIFDLDGTLLDTLEDLADAGNWVCAQHGWPGHPVQAYKRFIGNGAPKLLERVAPAEIELTAQLRSQTLEEFTTYYTAHKSDKTTAYPGMNRAVEQLKEAGLVLAVLTNKPDAAAGPVVERYYPGMFDVVQGALPDVPTKPDPTLLLQLMERIGAKAGEYLVCWGQRRGHPDRPKRRSAQLRRPLGVSHPGGTVGPGSRPSGRDCPGVN